jgi:5-methylcytosine-specific restriction endonuclease McrA
MDILDEKVLVLNKRFFPLRVETVEKVLLLLFKGKAVVMDDCWTSFTLDEYSSTFFYKLDRVVRTVSRIYIAPEVIRLTELDLVLDKKLHLTHQNIFLRDGYTCGYCGTKEGRMEIEHIIPKSRYREFALSSHTTWENVVTTCRPCNTKKGNRTPEEAGMPLLVLPHRPNATLKFKHGKTKSSWNTYLGDKNV